MKRKVLALSLLLSALSGWKFIVSKGYVYLAEQFEVYTVPQFFYVVFPSWTETFQAPNIVDTTKMYVYMIAIMFSFGSYKILQTILLLAPVGLAFASMFALSRRFIKDTHASIIAALVYAINPWFATEPRNVILRIDYAMTPLLFYLLLEMIEKRDLKSAVYFSVLLSIIADIRYVFTFGIWAGILVGTYMVTRGFDIKKDLLEILRPLILAGTLSSVLSIGRFLPQLVYTSKVSNVFAEQFTKSSVYRVPALDVFSTQTLTGPPLAFNMTYSHSTYYAFVLIVVLVLIVYRGYRQNAREIAPFLILFTVMFLFCVKGGVTFVGMPTIGRLLRHAKWNTMPLVLVVSILVGYAAASVKESRQKIAFSLSVLVILMVSSYPMITGDMNGYWKPAEVPRDYVDVNGMIKGTDFNVLWMPTFSPRKAVWVNASTPYKTGAPTGGFDIRSSSAPSFLYPMYYFFLYYTPVRDFRFSPLENFNDYTLLARLYSKIGIRYIALHNDVEWIGRDRIRGLSNEYIEEVGKELSSSGYTLRYGGEFVKLYEVPNAVPRFSTAELGVDIGGDRLTDLGTILSISNTTGIVFNSFRGGIKPEQASFFIVKENPLLDLINWDITVRPFSFTVNDQPEEGWVRTSVTSYDFLYYLWIYNITWDWYFDYGSGVVFTTKGSELDEIKPGRGERPHLKFLPNSMFLRVVGNGSYLEGHVQAGVDSVWAEAISTPVEVKDLSYYMIKMSVSGVSVVDLNAVVYYYDGNNRLLGFDVVNEPLNGTFASREISTIFYTLEKTKYIRIGIRSWRNPSTDSDWIVRDITLYDLSNSTKYNTLKMSFKAEEDGLYTAFMRVFYNRRGDKLIFELDGNEKTLYTRDDINAFKWVKLGEFYLTKGTHTVELKNIEGFNAVNIIIFVRDYGKKVERARELLRKKDVVYMYEAERDFYLRDGIKTENGVRVTYVSNEFIPPRYLPQPTNSWVFAPSVLNPLPVCPQNPCTVEVSYTLGSPKYSSIKLQTLDNSTLVQYAFKDINATPVVVNWDLNHENWSAYDAITLSVFGDGSGNLLELWYYNNRTRKHVRIDGIELNWRGWKTLTFSLPDYRRDDVAQFRIVLSWGRKEKGLGEHEITLGRVKLERVKGFRMWRSFEIFREGTYDVAVRAKNGTFKVYVDGKWCTLRFGPKLEWKTCTISLNPGKYSIRLVSPKNGSTVDAVLIYTNGKSLDELFDKKTGARVIKYERMSATKWRVRVRAEGPFVLVFTNGYDPLWVARVDGKEYRSMPLYGVINGFYIPKSGEYWITVEYKLQYYQNIGILLSIAAFVFTAALLWRQG